jgi:hypothetical protein
MGKGRYRNGVQRAIYLVSGTWRVQARYFVVLIEQARAGTVELHEFFERDLNEMRERFLNLANRVSSSHTLSLEHQSVYYAWK